jgi:hypothetical protein
MPRTKRTIARDSVFGSRQAAGPTQGISRPEDEKARQTGVWFTEDELDWLDSRCRDIRRGGWRSVTRSAMIRALIQAVQDQPLEIELTGVTGEAELAQAIRRALRLQ